MSLHKPGLSIAQPMDASVITKLPRHCIHLHPKPSWTISDTEISLELDSLLNHAGLYGQPRSDAASQPANG